MDPLGRASGQEVLDRLAAVNGRPMPEEEEIARALAQQQPQDPHHLGAVVRSRLGLQEEASVAAEGADGGAMMAER
jgi:hypothetical protein